MQICASEWAAVSSCPFSCIDGFRGTEIEGELGNDLPFETKVRAATETIDGRNGVGIEHIVLVGIDAVRPFAGIEALEAKAKA